MLLKQKLSESSIQENTNFRRNNIPVSSIRLPIIKDYFILSKNPVDPNIGMFQKYNNHTNIIDHYSAIDNLKNVTVKTLVGK